MATAELLPLFPFLILAGAIVAVLLASAFGRQSRLPSLISLVGLVASFVSLRWVPWPSSAGPLLEMDGLTVYLLGLILLSAFAICLLSLDYLRAKREALRNEYLLALLLATLGSGTLAASHHFVSFFLSLELLSISLYVLISYRRGEPGGLEAGTKYLVLAGTSSALLLFGVALIYAASGSLDFAQIGPGLPGESALPLLGVGAALLLVGIGFKLALAPFHLWTPDIYQGAPAPVSGYVATVSKGAVFALLLRLLPQLGQSFTLPLSVLAIASIAIGNLTALRQDNVKRLLAYSSIAHLGYLIVPLVAGGEPGLRAAAFYLTAYIVTTLLAFGVVSVLSATSDADRIADFQGLFWRRPGLALAFSAALLSLAGIPLTAGFVGKFFLVTAGVGGALWTLVVALVAGSAVGIYSYLRWISAVFAPASAFAGARPGNPWASSRLVLVALSLALVSLGIYPAPVLRVIDSMTRTSIGWIE